MSGLPDLERLNTLEAAQGLFDDICLELGIVLLPEVKARYVLKLQRPGGREMRCGYTLTEFLDGLDALPRLQPQHIHRIIAELYLQTDTLSQIKINRLVERATSGLTPRKPKILKECTKKHRRLEADDEVNTAIEFPNHFPFPHI